MAHTRAKGAALKIDISGTYTTVAQVENIDFQRTRATIETTNHDSDDDSQTFMPGLKNSTVSGTVSWDPANAQHAALETAFSDGTTEDFRIVYPDASSTTYGFAGIVTNFGTPAPVADKMMASIEIQVSGSVTKNPS